MSKLVCEGAFNFQESTASTAFSKIRRTGPVALLTLLVGCASNIANGQIFDYAAPAAETSTTTKVKINRKIEKAKNKSASVLLGKYSTGPGYAVQPDISSDGRYNLYIFKTEYGTYSVIGDDLARKHIQELFALDALKKRSKAGEFVHGVGSAITSPVEAVISTAKAPVEATKEIYTNVRRTAKSVRHGVSEAGEFIATFGNPEKKQPDREDDGLLESVVGRPAAKRRLAMALMVDPYTHFVPLVDELDKVASYSAAGEFGISKAVGFVPGVAGTVISGLRTLDSFTEQTLNLDPGETAMVNRERMKELGLPEDIIKNLLLNDKLTPTEKTQAVGYLHSLSGTPGLDELASFIATSDTRHGAFAALQTLSYLSARPFGDERVSAVEIIDRIPVFTIGNSKRSVIFTSDELAWTHRSADQLSKLGNELKGNGKRDPKMEIRISGSASPLAKRELKRQGWVVKTNTFDLSR